MSGGNLCFVEDFFELVCLGVYVRDERPTVAVLLAGVVCVVWVIVSVVNGGRERVGGHVGVGGEVRHDGGR